MKIQSLEMVLKQTLIDLDAANNHIISAAVDQYRAAKKIQSLELSLQKAFIDLNTANNQMEENKKIKKELDEIKEEGRLLKRKSLAVNDNSAFASIENKITKLSRYKFSCTHGPGVLRFYICSWIGRIFRMVQQPVNKTIKNK